MTVRDTLTTVNDGDQLNDGYFNDMFADNTNAIQAVVFTHYYAVTEFTSDDMTKSNFNYDANENFYYLSDSSGTLTYQVADDSEFTFTKGYANFSYTIFTIIDECNDTSFDTNIWTGAGSGSNSETGTALGTGSYCRRYHQESTNALRSCTLTFNTNLANDTDTYYFQIYARAGGGDSDTSQVRLRLNDGTSQVNLQSDTAINSISYLNEDQNDNTRVIYFDWSSGSEKCYYSTNNGSTYSEIDISSLNSAGTIQLQLFGEFYSGDTAFQILDLRFYYMRKIDGTETGTVNNQISCDGSNYENVTGKIKEITNTGDDGNIRLSATIDSDHTLRVERGWGYVSE